MEFKREEKKEDKRLKILQIIRLKGPVIPSQINKEIGVDGIIASAMLSELVDKGQLKISCVKIGNSPLYYAPGQEYKLQQFSNYLNEKDRNTFELLRQRRVLKDKDLEPFTRVSLRQIKDFAKPLEVKTGGESILFWKWYLITNEEASEMIKGMIDAPTQHKDTKEKELPRKEEHKERQMPAHPAQEERKPVQSKEIFVRRDEKKDRDFNNEKQERLNIIERPKPTEKSERPEWVKGVGKIEKAERPETAGRSEKVPEQKAPEAKEEPKDKFFKKIMKYFEDNNIKINDYKILRKEADIEFTITIPSTVGSLAYFCKAKNKKKVTDGDLSSLFIEGQRKKLPILFLTTGELTKKAKNMLDTEFKNMSVKVI